MMIRGTCAAMIAGGVILFAMTKAIPFLQFIFMDWISIFMMCGAAFIMFFMFGLSQTGLQYDSIPPGTAVINYIRRDGIIQPLLGKRVFAGESFLDVPKLGIIEDLGKDTVFLWGKKKVRFGIENINYTPDPRYFNVCRELYQMGFDDTDDLYNVMNIPNIDAEKEKAKKVFYLTRMADIYWNITHAEPRGAERLMTIFRRRREKNESFGPRRKDTPKIKEREKTELPLQKEEKPVLTQNVGVTLKAEQRIEPVAEPKKPKMTDDDKMRLIRDLLGEKD